MVKYEMEKVEETTLEDFLDAWAKGYISDVIFIRNEVYGKDVRGMADKPDLYKIVKAMVTVQP